VLDLDPSNSLDTEAFREACDDFSTRRHLPEHPDTLSFLEAIGATRNGLLTKGGLLFLGADDLIRRNLGDFEYRFSWKTPTGSLLVNDVWSGCIWNAVKRSRNHFGLCNRIEKFHHRDKEFVVPLLDEIAFHEAYLNALVHRDYSSEGMISVNFTGDKIVITSPGSFYGGVTAENIALHEPRHRNKTLARIPWYTI